MKFLIILKVLKQGIVFLLLYVLLYVWLLGIMFLVLIMSTKGKK